MSLQLILPELNKKNYELKDIILNILIEENDISLKQIYNIGKKKYLNSNSYQAYYKAINNLVELGSVLKDNSGKYNINLEWLNLIEEQIKSIKNKKLGHGDSYKFGIIDFVDNDILKEYTFETIEDLLIFQKKLFPVLLSKINSEKEIIYGEINHSFEPILFQKDECDKNLNNNYKIKFLLRGNSLIDNWVCNFYKNLNVKVKCDINCATYCDQFIYGDLIVQTFFTTEILNEIENYYIKATSIDDFDLINFLENIIKKKTKIKLVLYENKFIATELKKKIEKVFISK